MNALKNTNFRTSSGRGPDESGLYNDADAEEESAAAPPSSTSVFTADDLEPADADQGGRLYPSNEARASSGYNGLQNKQTRSANAMGNEHRALPLCDATCFGTRYDSVQINA